MKFNFFLIALMTTFFSCTPGEIIPPDPNEIIAVSSSCEGVASIKNMYREDAERIVLRATLADPASPWNDSIRLNSSLVEEVLGLLLAVHNGFDMIYRDSVIGLYGIHTYPDPVLNRMLVKVDEDVSWVQQWKLGNSQTGNFDVDQLMDAYGLSFTEYFQWSIGNFALLTADNSLNINALTNKFKVIPGVLNAQIDAEGGDGSDITYNPTPSESGFKELVYSVGYGNCDSECNKRRYWKFYIRDNDCNLQFRGSWGDSAP